MSQVFLLGWRFSNFIVMSSLSISAQGALIVHATLMFDNYRIPLDFRLNRLAAEVLVPEIAPQVLTLRPCLDRSSQKIERSFFTARLCIRRFATQYKQNKPTRAKAHANTGTHNPAALLFPIVLQHICIWWRGLIKFNTLNKQLSNPPLLFLFLLASGFLTESVIHMAEECNDASALWGSPLR